MMGLPFIAMPAFSAGLSQLQASVSAPVPAGTMAAECGNGNKYSMVFCTNYISDRTCRSKSGKFTIST